MTSASKPPVIDIDGPENEDWIKQVTRRRDARRSVDDMASAWADAAVSAIAKDKGWAPGPNAGWKRKDEVEPEARVPEHLRDRVASSLNSMNLLIRPEWEAVMTDRGLSEDAIVEANRLLNAWGSNKAQQERAAAEILEHLAHKDEVARTIQAASQLEEDAWAIWTEAHPDASAFIYRKGSALTEDIEAWTRNYHGAWMGNAGHIGWDTQLPFTLEAIHSKGYSILAGVNRGVGAPGEQEITLIRTEHLYPAPLVPGAKRRES